MKNAREAFKHNIRRQRGLSLIETAGALTILAVMMGGFASLMGDNAETMKAKGAAEKMVEVQAAAESYLKAKKSDLMTSTASGAVVTVIAGRPNGTVTAPPGSLQAEGFLSPGFVDGNGYGQRHALKVRRVMVAGQPLLDAIVTTYSGETIPNRTLPKIAGYIGAAGGYVPGAGAPSGTAGQIVGMGGGWTSSPAMWGTGASAPRVGSIVASMAFSGTEATSDFLYRTNAGGTEGNRMHASIDMNGNDLNAARNVAATGNVTAGGIITASGNISSAADVQGINIWSSGNVTAAGNVAASGLVTAGAGVSTGGSISAGGDIHANGAVSGQGGVYSNANISASGTVHGENVTATNRMTAYNLRATEVVSAGDGCTTRGLLAVTSNGSYVSCRGGLWSPFGPQGKYRSLGSHEVQIRRTNETGGTITVTAFGGTAGWRNECHLAGFVEAPGEGEIEVARTADSNGPNWNQCSISFDVANGHSWRVQSIPYPTHYGVFNVLYSY